MARQRFCPACKDWHAPDAWPVECLPDLAMNRSAHPGPMLIRDQMAPVRSMLDGKMYDSKRALRATYRAAGVVEVGNDSSVTAPKKKTPVRPKKEDVAATVSRAFSQAGLGA